MKFIENVWAAFLARVNPVSTIANPACMNMTRKPVMSVQTMLIEILLWPTVSMTSARVGFAGSFTGTSAAVPVTAPVGSGPLGSAGAAAGGAAEGAGAGSWAWVVTERRPQTVSPRATPNAKLRNSFLVRSFISSASRVRLSHAKRHVDPGGTGRSLPDGRELEGGLATLPGPNAHDLLQIAHEDLAVSELAGLGGLEDGFHRLLDQLLGQRDLDLDLGQELDLVLAAPVGLGVALLAAETLHLADRHPHDADLLQGVLHRLQQVRPHDGFDLLHSASFTRFWSLV